MKKWLIDQIKAALIIAGLLTINGIFNSIFQMYLYEH